MRNTIPTYWFLMAAYMLVSLLFVFVLASENFSCTRILANRAIFVALFFLVFKLKNQLSPKNFQSFSLLVIYAFLGSVYTETATLNTLLFDKQDPIVSNWDELIFGYQPAIEFSKNWNHVVFSEIMFMGYFSYYIIPLFIIFYLHKTNITNHFGFVFIGSFIVYYIIFILFPVQGPQFYFTHPQNYIEAHGVFGYAVKLIQKIGEAPTAAFPSSHIGITTIILIWLYHYQKKLLYYILPFSILLLFSTVYIKAHYAIDAIAGIISGIIIYWGINKFYTNSIQ